MKTNNTQTTFKCLVVLIFVAFMRDKVKFRPENFRPQYLIIRTDISTTPHPGSTEPTFVVPESSLDILTTVPSSSLPPTTSKIPTLVDIFSQRKQKMLETCQKLSDQNFTEATLRFWIHVRFVFYEIRDGSAPFKTCLNLPFSDIFKITIFSNWQQSPI